MTPQQIIGMFARLFAIWMVSLALQAVAIGLAMFSIEPMASITPYVIMFIYLLIALVLWFFPMVVAHKLIPRTSFDNKLNINAVELAATGCLIVGLITSISAIPHLTNYISKLGLVITTGQTPSDLPAEHHFELISATLQLTIGIYLVKKCRKIACKILKIE